MKGISEIWFFTKNNAKHFSLISASMIIGILSMSHGVHACGADKWYRYDCTMCVRDLEAWVQFWTNWRFSDSANTRMDYALLVTSNGVIIYIDVTNIMTIHSPANIKCNKNYNLLCRNIVLPRTAFTNAIENLCSFWLTSPFTNYVIWGLTSWLSLIITVNAWGDQNMIDNEVVNNDIFFTIFNTPRWWKHRSVKEDNFHNIMNSDQN